MLVFDGDQIFGDNIDGVGFVCDIIYNLKFFLVGKCILLFGVGGVVCGVMVLLFFGWLVLLFIVNCSVDKVEVLVVVFVDMVVVVGGNFV